MYDKQKLTANQSLLENHERTEILCLLKRKKNSCQKYLNLNSTSYLTSSQAWTFFFLFMIALT